MGTHVAGGWLALRACPTLLSALHTLACLTLATPPMSPLLPPLPPPLPLHKPSAPEEDEVALVVEGDGAAPLKVGVLAEQAGHHAADAVPQPRVKVVQDQLRLVGGRTAVALQHRTNG